MFFSHIDVSLERREGREKERVRSTNVGEKHQSVASPMSAPMSVKGRGP